MLMSLREAYSKFKEMNLSLKIDASKFCNLSMAYVKLFEQTPHQVCAFIIMKRDIDFCCPQRIKKMFF